MDTPVVINPSPVAAQIRSGLRSAILVAGGLGLLSHFLTPGQIAFIQSNEFLGAMSTIGVGLTILWGQIETRLHKKTLVAAANAAPDSKFVVVGESK